MCRARARCWTGFCTGLLSDALVYVICSGFRNFLFFFASFPLLFKCKHCHAGNYLTFVFICTNRVG